MPNPSFTLPEIQQLQAEGLVLRFPDIMMNAQVSLDGAITLLLRAAQQAVTVPFVWSWIDRAQDGQTFIVFLPSHSPFPSDGIRWNEPENKFSLNQGTPKELEVCEVKFGSVPGSGETMAARIRRRYRLVHGTGMSGIGAMPQLWVVHYTRGPNGPPIPPAVANQPVRMYPLRQVNEPPMFVAGDKLGQKAFPGQGLGGGMPSGGPGIGAGMPGGMPGIQPGIGGGPMIGAGGMPGAIGGMPGGAGTAAFNQQQAQALLAQQNVNMEMLEARRTHSLSGRGGPLPPPGVPGAPGIHGPPVPGPHGRGIPPQGTSVTGVPPVRRPVGPTGMHDDDDSGDEVDSISTRTLALTRYKRNHDLMNEVFVKASFGVQPNSKPLTSPYAIYDKKEINDKVAKLSSEIEALKTRADERKRRKVDRERENSDNAQMTENPVSPSSLSGKKLNSQLTVPTQVSNLQSQPQSLPHSQVHSPQPSTNQHQSRLKSPSQSLSHADSMDSTSSSMGIGREGEATVVDLLGSMDSTKSMVDGTTTAVITSESTSLAQMDSMLTGTGGGGGEGETGIPLW
ncbi:hypothetical protein J3R30DRAFT_3425986 [Lentinula aciculospora]|uniref:SWI/SNF and RSC complexes subunit Ssr4 N-terminal domain-containing protein n=1 Tax=Lentinula aciculospora TaxID=153920 RepID=A0A9W9AJ01_9AGAR|nr:hypothetical protein J3R30DRAFT_3453133 [Lentinula aciculospora]KAJ4490853.1 hypothetical protein J3R30DRAFT_3425986 [Lentinula aciculospora]